VDAEESRLHHYQLERVGCSGVARPLPVLADGGSGVLSGVPG
jgi:hypothetical protein